MWFWKNEFFLFIINTNYKITIVNKEINLDIVIYKNEDHNKMKVMFSHRKLIQSSQKDCNEIRRYIEQFLNDLLDLSIIV